MNGGDEGSGELCAARGNSPPALEGTEDVFNDVPGQIQFITVRSLLFPAFNQRDDAAISASLSISSSSFVSYALSARNASASKSSIRRGAWLQSATVPLAASHTRQLPSAICCSAPFCTANVLTAAARAACVHVCLDIRRIYHKDISGRLVYCGVRQHFPYSLVPLAAKPLVYVVPVPEFWRYISLRSACTRLPRYRVDKPCGCPSPLSRASLSVRAAGLLSVPTPRRLYRAGECLHFLSYFPFYLFPLIQSTMPSVSIGDSPALCAGLAAIAFIYTPSGCLAACVVAVSGQRMSVAG
jgi:hypothetical protein